MEFRRTAGPTLYSSRTDSVFSGVTDATGGVRLFPDGVFAAGAQAIVGELTVHLPSPDTTVVRQGYRVQPTYWFGDRPIAVQPVGPSLAYTTLFSDSATRQGRRGVVIQFERTGGIRASPDTFTSTSREDGWTGLDIRPLEGGAIQGNFTISVPGSAAPVRFNGLSLTTFDADSVVFWGHWLVGATGILYPLRPFPP